MVKYSTECKLKVVQEYLAGKGSYEALSKQHKIASRHIKTWVKVYEAFGSKGLERSRAQQTYTFELWISLMRRLSVFTSDRHRLQWAFRQHLRRRFG